MEEKEPFFLQIVSECLSCIRVSVEERKWRAAESILWGLTLTEGVVEVPGSAALAGIPLKAAPAVALTRGRVAGPVEAAGTRALAGWGRGTGTHMQMSHSSLTQWEK